MNKRLATVGLTVVTMLLASQAWAQPGRGGRPNPFGVGALLFSDEVRQEIELLDDQEQELREMSNEMRGRMRELFSGMRDLPREERRAAFQEAQADVEALRDEVEGRIKDLLQPHQFDRLRQIELQQQMQRRGSTALANPRVAEALGLSDDQRAELQRKAAEQQQQLQEKIRELREEAREEVLTVLTSEQRAKLDALIGQPFELSQDRFGGFRGRGGANANGPQRNRRPPRGGEPELE